MAVGVVLVAGIVELSGVEVVENGQVLLVGNVALVHTIEAKYQHQNEVKGERYDVPLEFETMVLAHQVEQHRVGDHQTDCQDSVQY